MKHFYEMNLNFFDHAFCGPLAILNRTKIKIALRQIKDWFNHQTIENSVVSHRIETLIRSQRIKADCYRYPPVL